MERNKNIKNLEELQLEISKIKSGCTQKETQLQEDVLNFIHQLSLVNIISKSLNAKNLFKLEEKTNLSGSIMAFVLPYLLNKTFLRKSNLLTKGVVSLLSGKLGQSLDIEKITQVFSQVKNLFGSTKKSSSLQFEDYGIPPDSETY